MSMEFRLPEDVRIDSDTELPGVSPDRALKNFCYVVSSVNDDALEAWAALWEELKNGVTPAGAVLPKMQQGFKPACGWSEFLEKFWLLKHYLDYTHRLCRDARSNQY